MMNPYSYNPTGYGMGYPYQAPQMGAYGAGMMQPGMMQNAPQTAPQQPQSAGPAVMQVSTVKQVEQVQVQPGGKALVLVANEPVIAMRMADNMGLTTTDYYHIEKFDPDAAPAAAVAGDVVTRAEFNQTVQALVQQIQQLQQAAPAEQKANRKTASKEAEV